MKSIYELSLKFILAILAFVCVVILRMLRLFLVIRLGGIDVSRIGNMYRADWYLSECSAGVHDRKNFDIFYFFCSDGFICNQQWVKMWKRVLRSVPFGAFFKMVNRISMKFSGYRAHILPMSHISTITTKEKVRLRNILGCKTPHIAFTEKEERFGLQALKELGVPDQKPFVCFHARDGAYLKAVYPKKPWDYHNYRNSNISNYLSAVEELTRRGYAAIRMGAIVKEELNCNHRNIIDYACNGKRTDFLDIYLGAKCAFFICSDAGISIIPEVFRRPAVYVNWAPVRRISPWVLNGLFIFKKFYSRKEKRFLNFSELVNLNFDNPGDNFFAKEGIELIENTPEEIADVVIEMEERIKGKWETTQKDEELQERFWALFGSDRLKSPEVRVGSKFLRQNEKLLTDHFLPFVEPKKLRSPMNQSLDLRFEDYHAI